MADATEVSVRDILYAVGTETACWRNDLGKRVSFPRHGMQERLALERVERMGQSMGLTRSEEKTEILRSDGWWQKFEIRKH